MKIPEAVRNGNMDLMGGRSMISIGITITAPVRHTGTIGLREFVVPLFGCVRFLVVANLASGKHDDLINSPYS
jgi:hypothetical protein